jgi:hypothetical protein
MTEAEWLACTDPAAMLDFLRMSGKASDRKLRLLAVACCRRVQHRLQEETAGQALDVLELFADGLVSRRQLKETLKPLHLRVDDSPKGQTFRATAAAWAVVFALQDGFFGESEDVWSATAEAALFPNELVQREKQQVSWPPDLEALTRRRELVWGREHRAQSSLVRDVFGPLSFRRMKVKKSWLRWDGETVPKIAQTIYDYRAFDLMPLLADALEEAGCSDADILNHCRQPGEHVRGCWLIDLLLGKS